MRIITKIVSSLVKRIIQVQDVSLDLFRDQGSSRLNHSNFHQQEVSVSHPSAISVMAVDNLPCELPRDASDDFGKDLVERVLPNIILEDTDKVIERASICKDGKLTPGFEYLSDYAY